MGVKPLPKIAGTPLDMDFRVGDKVRPLGYISTNPYTERTVERLGQGDNYMFLGGKTGPKYTAVVTGEYAEVKDWRFACHHSGAPFESTTLHEELSYDDGYRDGLGLGLDRQLYSAGGPHVSQSRYPDCRHLQQAHEFERRNNAAWIKGWKAGQERAVMKKKVDFTKPVRIVKDTENRTVNVIGETAPGSKVWMVSILNGCPPEVATVLAVDQYGAPDRIYTATNGWGLVFENVPQKNIITRTVTVKDDLTQTISFELLGDEIVGVQLGFV